MFGRKKREQEDPPEEARRYVVEELPGGPRQAARIQKALDKGSSKGWELIQVTANQGMGTQLTGGFTTMLYWDTAPRA